jgi:DNA-binding beta-propeller fold protein YncE
MVTVSFQQGVNGYAGTIDAMLRESRPAQNYATTTNVNIDSADTAGQRNEGLLYFAGLFGSGPGQIPLGATITSATLTLQVTEGSSQGGSLHRMLTNWTGLPTWTWDSFGNGIQFDGTEAVAAADLTTGAVRIGATNLDVTQSLQAWSAGATNYGWAFNPAGPDGWDFNSSEGTVAPKLTVTYNDSTAPPSLNPKVVNIHDTTAYKAGDPSGAGCGDPSGLAYVPGLNTLFIADSEHDESPYFSPTNLFAVRPDGTFKGSYSLTSFCKEPTGLAYNSKNGFLYITDDDARKVFWVDPKNPTVKLGGFSVKALGMTDPEDPKFDPITGNMYMLDGFSRTFFELTATGQLVRKFVLPSVMTDAEALAYDSSLDVFFVASGATRGTIFEMDHDGNVLATINLLNDPAYRNANGDAKPKIKGLELAPSSNPNDGDHLSLYAADYGQDQQPDGRLLEIDLGAGWLMA